MDIISALTDGLQKSSLARTRETLGDRTQYIGMSDIGKAADCLRAAVATKLADNASPPSLEKLLRLNRGHWFETGMAEAFRFSGQPFLYQLAIQSVFKGTLIQGHVDFIFIDPKGDVHLVEFKSCSRLPGIAYASHETQLFGQLGLLSSCWNKLSFSLRNGEMKTFPALVNEEMGVTLPRQVAIFGHILCLSMSEARVFGPYVPNRLMYGVCLDLASSISGYVNEIRSGGMTLADVPTATGFHPLCDWCDHNADCPRFTAISAPELEEDIQELQRLKAEREALDSRIQALDRQLRATCKANKDDWLEAETARIRLVSCEGKRTFDKDLLQTEMERHLSADAVADIMAAAYRNGKPYDRLMLNNIN
jgi:hypothetical protein